MVLDVEMRDPKVAEGDERILAKKDVEVAFESTRLPLNVLLSVRSVEDAAAMVNELPAVMFVPLMVERKPERRFVPMVDDAIT